MIWQKGSLALNGASVGGDPDALCSSNFGNGTGGDITFIGACVASPVDAGQTGRTNSVTLWVDSLYDASNTYISPTGADGWQDPCPDGCTLTAMCRENADTLVEFNLTILRQANQGFFDIGVNFEDVFCSAKVDCISSNNEPLKLLFRPGTSTRDTTIVSALACTGGAGSGAETVLYREPLEIKCGTSPVISLGPDFGKGNAWSSASADPAPTDAIWQYAVYADDESLTCNGQPCNKRYWNVAIGIDPSVDNCRLTTKMTASAGSLSSFTTPANSTYPLINVDVNLTDINGLICTKHPLDGGNGVGTSYTGISSPHVFDFSLGNSGFSAATPPAPASPNPAGSVLIPTSAFTDEDPPTGWTQCAGFINTVGDDVGSQVLDNCLNTTRLRMRVWTSGGGLTDDVYATGISLGSSWPDWSYLGGTMTVEWNSFWNSSTTFFSDLLGDACNHTTQSNSGFSIGNGNGGTLNISPADYDHSKEIRINCAGAGLVGHRVAFYR